jgi:hypothetical protein
MVKEDSGQLTSSDYDERKVNCRSTATKASERIATKMRRK